MTMTTDPTTATLITTMLASQVLTSGPSQSSQSPMTSLASPVTPPASVAEGILIILY